MPPKPDATELHPLELHPLNRDFAWAAPKGPFRRLTPEQARAFDERGFFVLEDALDAATLRALVDAIDPWEAKVESLLAALPERRLFIARAGEITFSTHLVLRAERARAFCASPLFQDLVHDLVGPDVRLYWDQAVYKKPAAEKDFPWHQDNGYNFVEPQQYLTCWVALSDATPENGCPWMAPGLHRLGTLRHWMTDTGWRCLEEVPDAVAVPLRAGSIAVFSSLTPHRTGPNRTERVRKSYIVQFAPDGARMVRPAADGRAQPEGRCDDPERQFPVLSRGAPVAAPPLRARPEPGRPAA
ncbi:MAG TPA: phytanoyl-CoA dioxygenase family protein [Myxococcota bacterium]|nr:phytanoyl-CoA dioxygenase family protein [Myxococcota bacterium]